ncbi:MAG: crossover junction endodeoxyribonuclease RuvC [Candidatus Curtissbacteria bacterium]
MIIFGIDPGTATTGYGVIQSESNNAKANGLSLVEYGCIVTPKEQIMPMRLFSIGQDLKVLLEQYKPDCIAIEQLFFGINSRTAMTVGQARGVVLSTVAGYGIPIFEYQGLSVKLTLTGSGKSDKKEVQKHVMKYLHKHKLAKPKNGYIDDAADALGVAICHVIKTTSLEGPKAIVKSKKR